MRELEIRIGVIFKARSLTFILAPIVKSIIGNAAEPNKPEVSLIITIFSDKSFTFVVKTAPTSYLLKKAAKIDKGCGTPGRDTLGSVTVSQCKEIAEIKMKDLNANDLDAAVNIVKGSARSMGMEVRD